MRRRCGRTDNDRPFDALGYAARCEVNFNHPDAVDGALLADQLRALLGSKGIFALVCPEVLDAVRMAALPSS